MRRSWIPVILFLLGCMPPSWGAGALLHPARKAVGPPPALPHRDVELEAEGATLRGWYFPANGPRREVTVVYLHGSGDNRSSGTWIAEQLVAGGFDVLALDSRAHGASGGDACTYGFHERRDLARALDVLGVGQTILLGVSLGGAVALQAAAWDPRVVGVVAVAAFSDLESVARERAPFVASEGQIREALDLAGTQGRFLVGDVSPVAAARHISAPVLLVHGAEDRETSPAHSERINAALGGRHRLILVPGAGHGDALGRSWGEVRGWMEATADGLRRPPR